MGSPVPTTLKGVGLLSLLREKEHVLALDNICFPTSAL